MINSQTHQLREVASKHTSQATELTKQYVGDYTAKAQQILHGQTKAASKPAPQTNLKDSDFPKAPKESFQNKQGESSEEESEDEEEPLVTA